MKKTLFIIFAFCVFMNPFFAGTMEPFWDQSYEKFLLQKVGQKLPDLITFPFYQYPNANHQELFGHFSSNKVPIFGYGSLMNKVSAARTINSQAVESMRPFLAFGVKRLFNYKATDLSNWGKVHNDKERAFLNMAPSLNMGSMVNGVLFYVNQEDLTKLVAREIGYDLVPIFVVSWDDAINQNSNVEIRLVYTFIASTELRNHRLYTSTEYYPVLGYLHAVQEAALEFGPKFLLFWNATTYLADGTTTILEWDETFTNPLE